MNVDHDAKRGEETGRSVLLVEADPQARGLIGSWLESGRFQVMACPGPRAPGYECVGGRTGWCPLIEPADVILLDLRLPSDDAVDGMAAADLLALYSSSGKPVVAFGPDPRIAKVFAPAVAIAAWPLDRYSLVRSVQDALDSRVA